MISQAARPEPSTREKAARHHFNAPQPTGPVNVSGTVRMHTFTLYSV